MKRIDTKLLKAELRWRISRIGRKKCNLVGDNAIARSYLNKRNYFGKYHTWAHYAGACKPGSYCRLRWSLQFQRVSKYVDD